MIRGAGGFTDLLSDLERKINYTFLPKLLDAILCL